MTVKKVIKRIFLVLLILIVIIISGLVINNQVLYHKYSKADITSDTLSEHEVKTAESIYVWLKENGDTIFTGFNDTVDLMLFNKKYEFLITDKSYEGWELIGPCFLGKSIYRRLADGPQDFARKLSNNSWGGEFETQAYYNVHIIEQLPIIVPPQLFTCDKARYQSMVIHEMLHAYQGSCDPERVDKLEHLHQINAPYEKTKKFNDHIAKEGKILDDFDKKKDLDAIVVDFLRERDQRYQDCKISQEDIDKQEEFEWLEGSARYAEYIAGKGSKSINYKDLIDISKKVKTRGDDRYYTLGMAQILLIQKLNIEDWEDKLLYKRYTPSSLLREYAKTIGE